MYRKTRKRKEDKNKIRSGLFKGNVGMALYTLHIHMPSYKRFMFAF